MMAAFLALGFCLLAEPIPKGDREATIVLVKQSSKRVEWITISTSGEIIKRFAPKGIAERAVNLRISPNGSKALLIALLSDQAEIKNGKVLEYWPEMKIYLIDLEKPEEPAKIICEHLVNSWRVTWLPDGNRFLVSELDSTGIDKVNDYIPIRNWIIDTTAKTKKQYKLPQGQAVCDLSNDGRTWLTIQEPKIRGDKDYKKTRGFLTAFDGLATTCIADIEFTPIRFSSNGKSVIGTRYLSEEESKIMRAHIHIIEIDTKFETKMIKPRTAVGDFPSYVCSIRNDRVAYSWMERNDRLQESHRYQLSLTDWKGTSPKVLYSSEPEDWPIIFDWR